MEANELESKFSKEFMDSVNTDAMAKNIFLTLLRDKESCYNIIEQLCKQRSDLIIELTKKITLEPMRFLIEPDQMEKIVQENNITTR